MNHTIVSRAFTFPHRLGAGLSILLLGLCLAAPALAAPAKKAGAVTMIGIVEFPRAYAKKDGKEIGILDSVYSPVPETYELLSREGDWLRIRYAGKPAWVRAKDMLPVDEALARSPYRDPLMCPKELPVSFDLGVRDGVPLRLVMEPVATLTGGSGIMRVVEGKDKVLWTALPGDSLVGCSPGSVTWPAVAGDLNKDGKPVVMITDADSVVPAAHINLFRWTGKSLEKVSGFYLWQDGAKPSDVWPASDFPFMEDESKTPTLLQYIINFQGQNADGTLKASIVQEDRSAGKGGLPVKTHGVALFRMQPGGEAFVLQKWIEPLK